MFNTNLKRYEIFGENDKELAEDYLKEYKMNHPESNRKIYHLAGVYFKEAKGSYSSDIGGWVITTKIPANWEIEDKDTCRICLIDDKHEDVNKWFSLQERKERRKKKGNI